MWYCEDSEYDALDKVELGTDMDLEYLALAGGWTMQKSLLLNSLVRGKHRERIKRRLLVDTIKVHLLNDLIITKSTEGKKKKISENDIRWHKYCKKLEKELIEIIGNEFRNIDGSSRIILTEDDLAA